MNKVYFILGQKCNRSCSFCYMRYSNDISSSIEVLNNIKDSIYHLIIIGGEPLLYYDKLIEIIENSKNVEEITITTNGDLLTKDNVTQLLSYKNVHLQISIYDFNSLIHIKKLFDNIDKTLLKQILIHFVFSKYNINLFRDISDTFYSKVQLWVSIDREINEDISFELIDLIEKGCLKKDMFRQYNKAGKDCKVFSNSNIIINGDKVVYDCLHRQSKGTKIIVNKDCLNCDNILCDACICNDIVENRIILCNIFRNLNIFFKESTK